MNAPQHPIPPQSTTLPSGTRSVSSVRRQAAFVRALLDELERGDATSSADDAVAAQLVEEIARLGGQCIETARALSAVIEAQESARDAARRAMRLRPAEAR